jgi:hypothetical protein
VEQKRELLEHYDGQYEQEEEYRIVALFDPYLLEFVFVDVPLLFDWQPRYDARK